MLCEVDTAGKSVQSQAVGIIMTCVGMHAAPSNVTPTTNSAAAAAAARPARATDFCGPSCFAATCTTLLTGLTAVAGVAPGST